MAQIVEEVIVIKFSKLVKNGEKIDGIINEEVLNSIEQVAEELAGDGVVIEVEKA